jgi:hypothetical protein
MKEEIYYGGGRSVTYKEGKMLFIWGHNEAIFQQFLTWWAPMERLLMSKKDMEVG